MKKLIIGITGLNGSGKDKLVRFLDEYYDIPAFSIGDKVRDIAKKEGASLDRKSLHNISQKYMLKLGKSYFPEIIADEIDKSDREVISVTGIRSPADIETFRERYNNYFILVYVEVTDPEIRYRRLRKRGSERDPGTYDEFMEHDIAEEEKFDLDNTITCSDITINNDGSLYDFYKSIMRNLVFQDIFKKSVGDRRVGIK